MEAKRSGLVRNFLLLTLAIDAFWGIVYVVFGAIGPHAERLFRVFDLDAEANPPTWWSGSQLLLIGVALLVLALWPFVEDARIRPLRPAFIVAGLVFTFFSMDEVGTIHEDLAGLLRGMRYEPTINGQGVWIFIYAAIAVVLLILLRGSIVRVWTSWRRECVTALVGLAFFVGGGVFVEILNYLINPQGWAVFAVACVEEVSEMAGESIILFAALTILTKVGLDLVGGATAEKGEPRELG